MICYVDIEHPSISFDPVKGSERAQKLQGIAGRFEEIARQPCQIVHYTAFSASQVLDQEPKAMVLSGCATFWEHYDLRTFGPLFGFLRNAAAGEMNAPAVLGTCGGHQLLALALGVPVEHMRWVGEGEADHSTREGWLLESGFQKVHLRRRDALFRGLPNTMVVLESHYDHLLRLPPGFLWLAQNQTCRVQAMRHRTRPIYGVQFHPEHYDAAHPHGRRLLANFFRLRG